MRNWIDWPPQNRCTLLRHGRGWSRSTLSAIPRSSPQQSLGSSALCPGSFEHVEVGVLAIISRSLARALSRLSSCLPPKTKQICTSNASAAPQGWLSKLGSLLGTLNNRCRIIVNRDPNGTIILTTTHMSHCHGQKRSCDDGLYPPGSGFCNKVFLVIHLFPQQDGFQGSLGHGSIQGLGALGLLGVRVLVNADFET